MVHTSEPEAVDACSSWSARGQSRPGFQSPGYVQPAIKLFDLGVELAEVKIGRYQAMAHGEGGLEQAGEAGSSLQMTDDCLDGADT